MLSEHIQTAGPERLAITLTFVDRLLGGDGFEKFEAVARHDQRLARLVEPVVGAPDALE